MSLALTWSRLSSGDFAYLAYQVWVKWHRLDLSAESEAALGLPPDSIRHSQSGGPDLVRVLNQLAIPPGSRILDIGSGKGGACLTMTKFPFAEICGIEISQKLVTIAKNNAESVGLPVQFHCVDAKTFTDLDRFTHIYLFNPFLVSVTNRFLQNLEDSVQRRPREVTIIYRYPQSVPPEIETRLFKLHRTITTKYTHPFFIFRND